MSDADLIKAKLAGLQIHLSYLEGWLRTHKGAMQEFKMRTLHDIVTGKKKAGLETISKCENVLKMLQVKMIKVEKPDAPPIADRRSTPANDSSEPLRATGTVDRIDSDRGPRSSSLDRSSSERSAPSHRRSSRRRTGYRDDRSTERSVVYEVDAPSRSNSRERHRKHSPDRNRSTSREHDRNRSTSRERDRDRRRRHRHSSRTRSPSRERYRRPSPDRAMLYTATESRRRSPSRERYRRSTPDQHGARSDSRDRRIAVADAKSVFKRLGDKIVPKHYENINIALRKDTKHKESASVGASASTVIRIATAGPSRPDTETLSAAEMAEMRADNAARFGSDITETTTTTKKAMPEGSSSANLDALLRKRQELTKELIGLDEMKQVVESVVTPPATSTPRAAAEQAQPQVASLPMSAQPQSAPVPRPDLLPTASSVIEPTTDSQSLVSLVQQALAIESSRRYQNNEPRPLSPTAMLAVQHVFSRPPSAVPQLPEQPLSPADQNVFSRPPPPLSPTAMLAVQIVLSNPKPLLPTPVGVPLLPPPVAVPLLPSQVAVQLPDLERRQPNQYHNVHAHAFSPDRPQSHYEQPHTRDPRTHSTANHHARPPISTSAFEAPVVPPPPLEPQTYVEHRRAKAAGQQQGSSSNHQDQQHQPNQQHHQSHHHHQQQHQRTAPARVEHKKPLQPSQQPQQPNRSSSSSAKATASDRLAAKPNIDNSSTAPRSQFADLYRCNDLSKTVDIISTKNAIIMQNFKIPKKRTKSATEQLTAEPNGITESTASPAADVPLPAARSGRSDPNSLPTEASESSSSKKAAVPRRRRSTCAPPTGGDELTRSAAAAADAQAAPESAQTNASPNSLPTEASESSSSKKAAIAQRRRLSCAPPTGGDELTRSAAAPETTQKPVAEKGALLELIQSLDTEGVQKVYQLLELAKPDVVAVAKSRAPDAEEAGVALPDDIAVPTMDDDDADAAAAADDAADDEAAAANAADAAAVTEKPDNVAMASDSTAPPVATSPLLGRPRKRLNELQKLNEDIRTMFISEGVMTANGRRNCTLSKPLATKRAKRDQPTAAADPMDAADELVTMTVEKQPEDDPLTVPKLRIIRRKTICLSQEEIKEMKKARRDSVDTSSLPSTTSTDPPSHSQRKIASKPTRKRIKTPLDTDDTDSETATQPSARKRPHVDHISPADLRQLHQRHGIRRMTVALLRQTVDQMLAAETTAGAVDLRSPSNAPPSMAPSTAVAITAPLDAIILKNTNKQMYASNPDVRSDCLLCDQRSRSLVLHYANEHPTAENYVSRLPPAVAAQLHTVAGRRQLDQAKRVALGKIRQMCVFCLEVRELLHFKWISHLQSHTGELCFQCRVCLRFGAWPSHSCGGKKQSMERLPAPHFDRGPIELHVCKLCNYAQFVRDRIVRHLVNQHGIEPQTAEAGGRITVIDCMRLPKSGPLAAKRKLSENDGEQVCVKVENGVPAVGEERMDTEDDAEVDVVTVHTAAAAADPTAPGNASDTASDRSVIRGRCTGRRTRQSMQIVSDDDTDQKRDEPPAISNDATDTDASVGPPASGRTQDASMADRLSKRFKSADKSQPKPKKSRSRRSRRSSTPTMDENESTDTTSEPSDKSTVFTAPASRSSCPSPAAAVRSQTGLTTPQRSHNIEQPELIIKSSPIESHVSVWDDDDEWEDCSDSEPIDEPVAEADSEERNEPAEQSTAEPTAAAPPLDALALLCNEIIPDETAVPSTAGTPMPAPPPTALVCESPKNTVINDIVKRLSNSIAFVPASAATGALDTPPLPPKPSPHTDHTKTINRIDNIGYSVFKNRVAFCCLVDGCGFESAVIYQMSSHLKEHQSGWTGYCYMCERQIYNNVSFTLNSELQHLKSAHIMIDTSKQLILSPTPQPKPPSPPTPAATDAPMFVISSVTGGITTSSPSSASHISQVVSRTGSHPIATVRPGTPVSPASSIPVSGSVVSLAKASSTNARSLLRPTAAERNVLKSWTTSYSTKLPDIIALMLHEFTLFSLHKCMAPSCSFATGNDDLALAHYRSHDGAPRPTSTCNGCVATWLECAYCDLLAGSAEQLVRHTVAEHRSSIFLCPHCFYRSCAAFNVMQHQLFVHRGVTGTTALVLVAPGKPKALSAELLQVHASRALHVPQLQCVAECRKRFYTLDAYEYHLFSDTRTGHGSQLTCALCAAVVPSAEMLRHQLEQHQIGRYACVNCAFGTNSVAALRDHMWRQHPSKLLYATCRVRRDDLTNNSSGLQPSDDSLDGTVLVYLGQKVNNQLFHRCPYTESQLCFVMPEQAATLGIEQPAQSSSIEPQPQLAISAVNSISKESFNASSVRPLLNDVSKHTITLDQILNLDEVEKYFLEHRPASVDPMAMLKRAANSTAAGAIARPSTSKTAKATTSAATVVPVQVVAVNGVPVAAKPAEPVADPLPKHSELVQREIDTAARALLKDTGLTGRELFRCAEDDCTATADDQKAFNVHMMQHGLVSQTDYRCWHCNVRSKNILALVQHIVGHSRHRYFCIFCDHTGAKNADMVRHMRDTHNRFGLMNLYLNQAAGRSSICSVNGGDSTGDQPMVTCPRGMHTAPAMYSFGLRLLARYRRRESDRNKRHFGPDEVDQLPQSAILFSPIFCRLCGFNSKVRTNMIRHLQSCKTDLLQQQPQKQRRQSQQQLVDPVNPVPCLDRGALHFDRMRNLACSSNDDGGTTARDVATATETAYLAAAAEREVSKYVPETNRFVCNAADCHYMSQTEAMLKNHLFTLHANEQNYACPHCAANLGSGNVERIIAHLRLHDSCVFKCTSCPFHKSSKALVAAHVANVHTDAISLRLERFANAPTVCTVATTLAEAAGMRRGGSSVSAPAGSAAAADANAGSSNSSTPGGAGGSGVGDADKFAVPAKVVFRWQCSLCSISYGTRNMVMEHAASVHSITWQYQCTVCMLQSNLKNVMLEHLATKHPGSGPQAIKTFYARTSSAVSEQNTPIWRRDDPNKVKSIRGILIDSEEQQPTANADTPSASPLTSTRVKPQKSYRRIAQVDHNQDPNDDVQIIDTVETLLIIESDDEESEETPPSPSLVVLSAEETEKQGASYIGSGSTSTSPDRAQENAPKIEHQPERAYIYNCKYCSKRARTVELLHAHWQVTHKFKPRGSDQLNGDEPFIFHVDENLRCLQCPNDASIPKRQHRSHAGRFHAGQPIIMTVLDDPKKCGLCPFVATANESMQEHGELKHPCAKQLDQTLLNRPIVPLSAKSLQALQQIGHQDRHKCLYCEEVVNSKKDFELHHASKHARMPHLMEVLVVRPRFACTICDQLADTEQEVVQHLQHHNIYKFHKKYKCVHCPAAFGKKGAVREHCQEAHGINSTEWQLTPLQGRLAVYRRIKILFPNGLMVCKAEVASTRWGDMTDITRVINEIEEQELAEQRQSSVGDQPEDETSMQNGKGNDPGLDIAESATKCAIVSVDDRPEVARP